MQPHEPMDATEGGSDRRTMPVVLLWTLAALVYLSGGACAQLPDASADLNEGIAAYNSGDFPSAFKHLQMAVDRGSAEAMANLGYMYARGHGVPRDAAFALQLYRRGAAAGNAEAMDAVGYRYNFANVPDFDRAAHWYCRAMLLGNLRAMNNLAILFYNGQGVPRDLEEARSLWRQATALGHLNAQTNLGDSLALDQTLPDSDRQKGLELLLDAALRGRSLQAQNVLRSRGYTGSFPTPVDMLFVMLREPANPISGHSKACGALVS